jgi:CBS domain-containing protein
VVRVATTDDPITVAHDMTAAEVRQVPVDHRVNAVPVVAGDRLVGIVTRHDVLRCIDT